VGSFPLHQSRDQSTHTAGSCPTFRTSGIGFLGNYEWACRCRSGIGGVFTEF
jgi:hypothetical protein